MPRIISIIIIIVIIQITIRIDAITDTDTIAIMFLFRIGIVAATHNTTFLQSPPRRSLFLLLLSPVVAVAAEIVGISIGHRRAVRQ